MAALIVIGDRTSHGGTVIGATPTSDTHGKQLARVGDRVVCPRHGANTVIISGDPTLIIDGQAAARHGDATSCGATLISSQVVTTDDPGGGGASSAGNSSRSAVSVANAAVAAASLAALFDLRFLVQDQATGKPLPNIPYRITLATGEELIGKTDSTGLTGTIGADSAVEAHLEAPYYGDSSTSTPDTGSEHGTCGC